MSLLLSFPILISVKVTTKLVTKFTNNFVVSDVIRVIEGAVKAQYEPVCMTAVMLHSSMNSNAQLTA